MKQHNGVYLRVVNYDTIYDHQARQVVLMNDFDISLEADRKRLNSLIYTSLDGDSLSSAARCGCGAITGMENHGVVCNNCYEAVAPVTEKPLESILWLKAPEGIRGFINLTVWRILHKNLTHSGFSILDYLCDPRYKSPRQLPHDKQRKLDRLEIPRGYNHFVDNYQSILTALQKANLIGPPASARRRRKIIRFLELNYGKTFSEHLPFPTKLGFIKESANNRVSIDPKMVTAVDAAYSLIGIDNRENSPTQHPMSLANKESRMTRALNNFNEYYQKFEAEIVFKKPGIKRKLIYGTRQPWGFRSVITSRQKPHRQDGLEMPWSLSVLLFKTYIQNKLLKKGLTPNEINAMIYENTLRYHPEIHRIFNELLEESPTGTIPTLFGRNPTLTRGSVGFNQIDSFKTDPTDNTTSMSPQNLIDKNADFDGRALPSLNPFNCWKPLRAA